MKVNEFCDMLEDIAKNYKTIYIKGCFGAPMNKTNKVRYTNNLAYNKNRADMINACSADTFGFDCCNLAKGILWGWNGNKNAKYGGATYKSNGVPDVSADGMIKLCDKVSEDFTNIQKGECVWMSGHVGFYVGDGKVVECTPKWNNNVQYSNLGNIGCKTGNWRNWKKHGFLPWVDYSANANVNTETVKVEVEVKEEVTYESYHLVKKGESLSKIAKIYNLKWLDLAKKNNIKFPYIIKVGQKIKL